MSGAEIMVPADTDISQLIEEVVSGMDISDQPPSPWATHYGFEELEPGLFGADHTWIAPREPPVHPSSSATGPEAAGYRPRIALRPGEYDTVFSSERLQVSRFKGLRTREARLFAQVDGYQPPEDADTWFDNKFGGRMINVDESQHLLIFRKKRWMNYDVPILKTMPRIHGADGADVPKSARWSVDCPAVWNELKVCIELADRILKHSFKGSWMQALLSRPDLFEYSEQSKGDMTTRDITIFKGRRGTALLYDGSVDPTPVSGNEDDDDPLTAFDDEAEMSRVQDEAEKKKKKEKTPGGGSDEDAPGTSGSPKTKKDPSHAIFVEPDWIDNEDQCFASVGAISNFIYWTFFDKDGDPRPEEANSAELYYVKGDRHRSQFCVVSLNVEALRPLLDQDSSKMERTLATQMVALTMIRGFLKVVQAWYQHQGFWNLTYETENVLDLPSSFENAVFGGQIEFPFHHDAAKNRKGNSLILTGSDFPKSGDFGVRWFPNFDRGSEYHTVNLPHPTCPFRTKWHSYPIPGVWSLNMVLESFWEIEVKRFGRGTLFFPKDFRAREHRMDDAFGSHHFETRTHSATFRPTIRNDAAMVKLNELLVAKRADTSELRPWFWDAYYEWQLTPYSMPLTRWYVKQINRWFIHLSVWDEFRIQEIAKFWLSRAPSFNGAPLGWFYSALADLVVACLPVRAEDEFVRGLSKSPNSPAFRIEISNASNPVHVQQVRDLLEKGSTQRRSFTLQARTHEMRMRHFVRAWNKFEIYFRCRPHHAGLKASFWAVKRYMYDRIKDPESEDVNMHWNFLMPAYSEGIGGLNWEHADMKRVLKKATLEFIDIGHTSIRRGALQQFAASVADAEEKLMQDLPPELRDTPGDDLAEFQGQHLVIPPGLVGMAKVIQGIPVHRYYTIGEIGDHAKIDDMWVIVQEEEEDEMVIYDISEACEAAAMTLGALDEIVGKSEYGFTLEGGIEEHFPSKQVRKVGYVLQFRHIADVAENDGKDGRPFWIHIGLDIFDITDVPFDHEQELEAVLKSKPGGNPMASIFAHERFRNELPNILDRLSLWKCGRLREYLEPAGCEICFTEDEVAWYEFPQTGMYTIIENDVYDLTEFLSLHPGGRETLSRAAGKDATQEFIDAHGDDAYEVLYRYEHLRIGHIIQSVDFLRPLEEDELEYKSHIYKITGADAPKRKGYFGGKAINELNLQELVPRWEKMDAVTLDTIWWRDDLYMELTHPSKCIARREAPKVFKDISLPELNLCDGAQTANSFNEAWLAVGRDVYDMTTVIQYGERRLADHIKRYVGNVVKNVTLANLIRERYQFRKVATLVNSQNMPDPDLMVAGRLGDGTLVQNKPRLRTWASLADMDDDMYMWKSTFDGNISSEATPRENLRKRKRSPEPNRPIKAPRPATAEYRDFIDQQTRKLHKAVKKLGELDVSELDESLLKVGNELWRLRGMDGRKGETGDDGRKREESLRLGVEVERGVAAHRGREGGM